DFLAQVTAELRETVERPIHAGGGDFEGVLPLNGILHIEHGTRLAAYPFAVLDEDALGLADVGAQGALPAAGEPHATQQLATHGFHRRLQDVEQRALPGAYAQACLHHKKMGQRPIELAAAGSERHLTKSPYAGAFRIARRPRRMLVAG